MRVHAEWSGCRGGVQHISIDDYRALGEPLEILRRRGVKLAVDDAGSGYASLRHILQLDPDIIKLVRDLDQDPARAALVTALVGFAHAIGASVTAEGVETAEERLQSRTGPALRTLARRSAVPVAVDVRTAERLPQRVEVGVYCVADALA
jgi:predicted signal transduction protein with EAL and GGDEF domain